MFQVCFWLIENDFRVLIAACDTFRAGAVEQLQTHCHKLNALHSAEMHGGQQMVQLYEKGYGKDAAGIAMEAINYGNPRSFLDEMQHIAFRLMLSSCMCVCVCARTRACVCVSVCVCMCVCVCMPRLWTSGKRFEIDTPSLF